MLTVSNHCSISVIVVIYLFFPIPYLLSFSMVHSLTSIFIIHPSIHRSIVWLESNGMEWSSICVAVYVVVSCRGYCSNIACLPLNVIIYSSVNSIQSNRLFFHWFSVSLSPVLCQIPAADVVGCNLSTTVSG